MTTSITLRRSALPVREPRAAEFAPHYARLADGALHYVDEGHGEPIVFVHGTPTWSFEYRHLIARFSRSHRCLALDHLGFGLSERPVEADYGVAAHAARFAAWMQTLDLPPCTLLVHDFGGPIAIPWALAHPERVRRVVLINTWLWSFRGEPAMERGARLVGGFVGRLLYRYVNASLRLLMPSAYADRRRLTPEIHRRYLEIFPDPDSRERVLHRLARELLDARGHLDKLWAERAPLAQLPLLIIWGLADSALPRAYLERLRAAFPQAAALALEDAGHWPHEEAPTQVGDALAAFLAERAAR